MCCPEDPDRKGNAGLLDDLPPEPLEHGAVLFGLVAHLVDEGFSDEI